MLSKRWKLKGRLTGIELTKWRQKSSGSFLIFDSVFGIYPPGGTAGDRRNRKGKIKITEN